jgi:hypothetical protein
MIAGTFLHIVDSARRIARLRRLVFFLCVTTFVFGGVAHAAHYGLERGAASTLAMAASPDGTHNPHKGNPLAAETCSCCSLPALPIVAATIIRARIESAIPIGRAVPMQAHAPAIESPPPKTAA